MTKSPKENIPACVLVLAVYVTSFFLPAHVAVGGEFHGTTLGLGAFLFGLFSQFAISWFANPALWLGTVWMAQGQWKKAVKADFISLACAASAMVWGSIGGFRDHLAIGYFVWLASTAILAVAAYRGFYIEQCERAGTLTPEFHRYLIWMPRVFLLLVAIPVLWFLLSESGRMKSVDYFAKGTGQPQDAALSKFLNDPSLAVRMHAADSLVKAPGHGNDPKIKSMLNAGLASSDPKERIATLEFLRDHEWSDYLSPPPVKLLADPDAKVRLATAQLIEAKPAIAAFYHHPMDESDINAILKNAMSDPDKRIRKIAATRFERYGGELGALAMNVLVESTAGTNVLGRDEAVRLLSKWSPGENPPKDHFLAMLTNTNATLRSATIDVLTSNAITLGPRAHASIPALAVITNDPDPEVRAKAEAALKAVLTFQRSPEDASFVGAWRREYDWVGRHRVDVHYFQPDGAWTNWHYQTWSQTNRTARGATNAGFVVNTFTSVVHVVGTWYIENHSLHAQQTVKLGTKDDGHHSFGKIISIESNRFFTTIRPKETSEFVRVSADADVKMLLKPASP